MARKKNKQDSEAVTEEFGIEAKQDSSWTVPMTILGVTLLLSFGFLYYYFGPTIREIRGDTPDPSASAAPISMTIGDIPLVVPTNYTRFPRARRGGERQSIALYALLPDLEPFTPEKSMIFDGNEPDSPVIYFEISEYGLALEEGDRLVKVYLEKTIDPNGRDGPYGLTAYDFMDNTGYKDEDLFVYFREDDEPIVLRCYEESELIPSPHCRRDMRLNENLAMSYRYKRPWLAQWREIDQSVRSLVLSLLADNR